MGWVCNARKLRRQAARWLRSEKFILEFDYLTHRNVGAEYCNGASMNRSPPTEELEIATSRSLPLVTIFHARPFNTSACYTAKAPRTINQPEGPNPPLKLSPKCYGDAHWDPSRWRLPEARCRIGSGFDPGEPSVLTASTGG